jgi:hypothetical protein
MTVSVEIHQVLRLVPGLVARMSRWQQRQAAKAIGNAIREVGGDVQRVVERVERRYALLRDDEEVRDPYAWLAHRAVRRRGCDLASCEQGTDMVLGGQCQSCAYQVEGAKARHAERRQQERNLAAAVRRDGRDESAREAVQPPATPPRLPRHQATAMPSGVCAPLTTQQDQSRIRLADLRSSTYAIAWPVQADNTEGISLREQLAAKRIARELAAASKES